MTAPVVDTAGQAQAAQTGLVIAMDGDLARAWQQLDIGALKGSIPDFSQLINAIARRYGLASAALAARYYKLERAQASIPGQFTVMPAPVAGATQVSQSVDWALQPLWAQQPDLNAATTNVRGVAEKLVLDVGRNTIVNNVHRDLKAHGWARITEPKPCAFCALLAMRGAVYRSDRTADFRAHDHCRCHVQPLFGPYEAPDRVQQWQQLYQASTTGGNSAKTRREWRRAFDAQP